jgi:hypothetical protein
VDPREQPPPGVVSERVDRTTRLAAALFDVPTATTARG